MEWGSRVLLVNIGPKKTGVGNYASLLLNYAKLQYDVLNISLFGRGYPDDFPRSKNGKTFFFGQKTDNFFKNYIIQYFLLNKREFFKFLDSIGERYDCILLDQQDLAMMANIFHSRFNCDIYITVHDMGHFKYAPFHPFKFFLIKNFKALKSENIKAIICDSINTAHELAEKYPDISNKIRVVELSVDQNRYAIRDKKEARKRLNLPLDKILALSVGKDGYVKNVRNFINSIRYIKNDNVTFVRVGKLISSKKDFELLPNSQKERIVVAEDVSDDVLPLYYNAADIFVFPSLKEGFGLELLEAHLSGNIVITTDRPPMNDLVIPGASMLIKNPDDPEEIAGLIDTACEKYDIMQKELMNALSTYKNRFSVERFVKETEDILRGDH